MFAREVVEYIGPKVLSGELVLDTSLFNYRCQAEQARAIHGEGPGCVDPNCLFKHSTPQELERQANVLTKIRQILEQDTSFSSRSTLQPERQSKEPIRKLVYPPTS